MESIARDKLVVHTCKNNLISEKQHGFVPKKNCMTNLLICLEKWTTLLDNGFPVDVIDRNFAKAFDRVPHQRLLKKMINLGISGKILNRVKAFLNSRKQRVRVENKFSSWTSWTSWNPARLSPRSNLTRSSHKRSTRCVFQYVPVICRR